MRQMIKEIINKLEPEVKVYNKDEEDIVINNVNRCNSGKCSTVKKSIDKSQKEFFLREQIKAIKDELGEKDEDSDTLIQKIKDKKLPKETEEKVLKEVQRLNKVNPSSPDYSIILNYLDWILELPFNEGTIDTERKTPKI